MNYLSPINIIFYIFFLAYIFDIKSDTKIEKYNHTTYDILNIFLFICLILTFLIISESIFLKILNK